VEHPRGRPAVPGVLGPEVVRRNVEPLSPETNPDQPLRRAPTVAPQRAVLPGERQVELAGCAPPGVGTVALAHLDDVAVLRIVVDDPVEAVRTEVHQAAAGVD